MTVRFTEDDFDIMAEHEALKSPDAGAIVTFTGTVRDLPTCLRLLQPLPASITHQLQRCCSNG